MIVVAVLGLIFARPVNLWYHERNHRDEVASLKLGDLELFLLMTVAGPGGLMHPKSGHPMVEAAKPVRTFIEYHNDMARKYTLAGWKPWLPVDSDPPAPRKPTAEEVERLVIPLQNP